MTIHITSKPSDWNPLWSIAEGISVPHWHLKLVLTTISRWFLAEFLSSSKQMNISKGWRLESSMATQIRRDYLLQHVIPLFVESNFYKYRVKFKIMNHQSPPPSYASDLADSSFTASSLILALLYGRGIEKTTANHSKNVGAWDWDPTSLSPLDSAWSVAWTSRILLECSGICYFLSVRPVTMVDLIWAIQSVFDHRSKNRSDASGSSGSGSNLDLW